MKVTKILMGMPVTVEVQGGAKTDIEKIYDYLTLVDKRFSPFKSDSEVSKINKKLIERQDFSSEMNEVLSLANRTKTETEGYFDVFRDGILDPSGIVKGWAIKQAAERLKKMGYENFYVEAGGDIEVFGQSSKGSDWTVGIKNPFNTAEIVKVVKLKNQGMATSGSYERGQHIYNPHNPKDDLADVVSITLIGLDVLEADRFATAAFAMGKKGINFIENKPGLEGYMIDSKKQGTETTGFKDYVI